MKLFNKVFEYRPKNTDDTHISWECGDSCFEMRHEETNSRLFFDISEIPKLIEALEELKDIMMKT